VSGAVACLVASSICIEVGCPNRVVQCSGLRSGSLRLTASSLTYYAICWLLHAHPNTSQCW